MDSGRDVSILEDLGYNQANEEGDVLFISFECNCVSKTCWLVATFFCVCFVLFGIFMPPPRGR